MSYFEVLPLCGKLAAEVRGLDLRKLPNEACLEALQRTWWRFPLLLFRGQALEDGEHVRFAQCFGELEIHPSLAHRSSDFPAIYRVANTNETGELLPSRSKEWEYIELSWLWHSDSSFREIPSKGSVLRGIEIPSAGGDTLFSDLRAAYDTLDEPTKAAIASLRAVHSHDHLLTLSEGLQRKSDRGEYTDLPPVSHPLVRIHPDSGRRSLFISPHTMAGVQGMPEAEGRALLDVLIAHATSQALVYRHRWQPHDVLMWDNRCTMHAVTPYDASTVRRVLHRTTIAGTEAPLGVQS